MPVSLLEHIISHPFASLGGIRAMTPAKDLQEYVDSFFIFPCCDLSDSLVYNDGTPMLAFLSEAEDQARQGKIKKLSTYSCKSFAGVIALIPPREAKGCDMICSNRLTGMRAKVHKYKIVQNNMSKIYHKG